VKPPYTLLVQSIGLVLAVILSPAAWSQAQPLGSSEPTNAREAAAKKADADAKIGEAYQAWVSTLPEPHRRWEEVLQANLGTFYLPHHKADKVAKRPNAWDFVEDEPNLPRVLIIGDSVSRGYTQATREALRGKANVHRAPENCGPTANGLRKIEVWLGEGRWDVIHFNFGIHDRATPLAEYSSRLEQLVQRMQRTGAKLIWATTTPIPEDPSKNQSAASIIERNEAAAQLMQKHHVGVDDLFSAMTPHLGEFQLPKDVHFNAAGYDFLGRQVAASIESVLPQKTR
jgi:lysophospholipase L1-like esterase